MHMYKSNILWVTLFGICLAKGGGGGRGGGGGGGGHSGSSGGRAARSSVGSSSGSRTFSSPGRSSFSSAAKGGAVGGAAGFAAGYATHSMIHSHVPITMGHNTYYWSNHYTPSRRKNMTQCALNVTNDPLFSEFEFDNSTDNSTWPEQIIWECPVGRCDLENMECIENKKSTIVLAASVIIIVIFLTVFCAFYGRIKKRCNQRCEQRRRQDYEIESRGSAPVDGMAPLPKTPIPRSNVRRPYSAKV